MISTVLRGACQLITPERTSGFVSVSEKVTCKPANEYRTVVVVVTEVDVVVGNKKTSL